MGEELKSFQDVVRELSEKYNVPFEIVESILIEWTKLLYENMRESFNLEG
jgi:hypothetical protein